MTIFEIGWFIIVWDSWLSKERRIVGFGLVGDALWVRGRVVILCCSTCWCSGSGSGLCVVERFVILRTASTFYSC